MNDIIFYFFYNLSHQFALLDKVIIFSAVYLPYIVVACAFLFLVFHHDVFPSKNPFKEFFKKWEEFFLVFFSGLLAWLISKVLKILFHTSRPFLDLPNVEGLFNESGFAFPSSHSAFFFAIAFALFFNHKRVGYVFFLFALLIGIARIVSGVHFPIDILGGLVLGWLVAHFLRSL